MEDDFYSAQTAGDQIIQDIYIKITNGTLKIGEKLPSIRASAVQWSVSPDTVQRAYSQLEQMSIIKTKRGLGTFVNNDENWIRHFRIKFMLQKLDYFVNEMKDIGLSLDAVIAYIKTKYKKGEELCIETAGDAEKFIIPFLCHQEFRKKLHCRK
jgi:DNA-binding transcriptional regulator YhcF (GntR family)